MRPARGARSRSRCATSAYGADDYASSERARVRASFTRDDDADDDRLRRGALLDAAGRKAAAEASASEMATTEARELREALSEEATRAERSEAALLSCVSASRRASIATQGEAAGGGAAGAAGGRAGGAGAAPGVCVCANLQSAPRVHRPLTQSLHTPCCR